MRVLTEEEAKKIEEYILKSSKPNAREILALFRILLYTGMRIGELKSLTWEDVDLEERIVKVTNKGNWTTKSKKNRYVPFPEFLVDEFRYLKDTLKREKPYVYYKDYLTKFLRKASQKLGIEEFTAHTLRHTYASWLAMKGVPLQAISKLLGHSNISTTEIYAKFLPSALKSVVDNAFGGTQKDEHGQNLVKDNRSTQLTCYQIPGAQQIATTVSLTYGDF